MGRYQQRQQTELSVLDNLGLSPFERGWVVVFEDIPRQAIVDRIDTFYSGHPGQRDRHVLDVVWKELIVPALPAGK